MTPPAFCRRNSDSDALSPGIARSGRTSSRKRLQNPVEVPVPVTENIKLRTPRLGPVGGRIVAEVFVGLMLGDPNSLLRLDPLWQPPGGAQYALKDFVRYAIGL